MHMEDHDAHTLYNHALSVVSLTGVYSKETVRKAYAQLEFAASQANDPIDRAALGRIMSAMKLIDDAL